MDISDEEQEPLPESASNYYFVDGAEEPISFCVLPYRWSDAQDAGDAKRQVFLHGVGDDGLQKIYKQVTAWKLELDGIRPVIYVLSKDKKWMQLSKPRKSYQDTIRKILITIQCLHYLRSNPDEPEKSVWAHLRKEFSYFESRPSLGDLQDYIPFIREMSEKDAAFSKCQLIPRILDGTFGKSIGGSEDLIETKNSDFINDEDNVKDNDDAGAKAGEDDSDEEPDFFDSVCALCDNGGDLLCCEGRCLRSFHAHLESDADGDCKTLGYTKAQLKAIKNFMCPNCRFKQHQCYACGKLGSSDKSVGAEVFRCVSATCGHFYHPRCVAKLLHPKNETDAAEQEKKIASGGTFICPVHKCLVCKGVEDKEVEELQFGVCRRCPATYHRKCLPSEICFDNSDDDSDDEDENRPETRAWNNLLSHNRILIYCMKHKIDPDLETPLRNHIKFPEDPEAAERKKALLLSLRKSKVSVKKSDQDLSDGQHSSKKAMLVRKSSPVEENGIATKKAKIMGVKKELGLLKVDKPSIKEKSKGLGIREMESGRQNKSLLRDLLAAKVENSSPTTGAKRLIALPEVDPETQKRVIALVRRSPSSSLTLEKFILQKDIPSTHAYAARHIDKTITLGKVEGSIEAIQTALQKVAEDDGNTDNAKTVCEPGIVIQMTKWKSKLAVYLSPFLHGLLYTSFGRHFTKVDKLKEIVERLHWYVQNGDTIVDFCCGANDFSTLMKEKLEATGKKCSYRNFDIIPPKNDFNFTKRDWMKVRQHELPPGSQLIMGLNPPFGVKGALANKFIDKALEFRPKLVVLIVPKETERLDVKRGYPYDLVWEDDQKLSGKAFYMPGNVDVNDKLLEQWNVSPPPLYLWSRPDWTARHIDIAKRYGHLISRVGETAAAVNETKIPSPVNEEKPPQVVEAAKPEPSVKANDEAHGKESESAAKKESRSSKRNRKRHHRENNKQEVKGVQEAKAESDMSISPGRMETKEGSNAPMYEHPPEKTSEPAIRQDHGDAYERILNTARASSERFITNEDKSREIDYAAGSTYNRDTHIGESIYGARSEERYQGYGSGISYGLPDRLSDGLHSGLYGQTRSTDLRTDTWTYGAATSGYGTSASTLGLSGLSSGSYGYADSAIRSVTDRYTSRMSPGLPTSSLGSSMIDKYAPRLDSNITYARRSSTTPDNNLQQQGLGSSAYGTARDPYAPGSRYPSSGWLND